MKKGGTGGNKTLSGSEFEKKSSLENLFKSILGYELKDDTVYYKKSKVAHYYLKYDFYSKFLKSNNIYWKEIITSRLVPDEAILVHKIMTMFIVEIKYQGDTGSADEKLQTCRFKTKQYKKLLKPLNIDVKYVYVLNDWFRRPKYRDVLEYIHQVGCYYFFNELPLKFLNLPRPRVS